MRNNGAEVKGGRQEARMRNNNILVSQFVSQHKTTPQVQAFDERA